MYMCIYVYIHFYTDMHINTQMHVEISGIAQIISNYSVAIYDTEATLGMRGPYSTQPWPALGSGIDGLL